jgi:hypothetical protein
MIYDMWRTEYDRFLRRLLGCPVCGMVSSHEVEYHASWCTGAWAGPGECLSTLVETPQALLPAWEVSLAN